MRKIIYVLVMPLITILLLILKFPDVETQLKSINTNAVLASQIFLVFATVLTYYVTMYTPYVQFERLAKKRWLLIDVYAERLQKQYSEYILNINIMVPKVRYFYSIEPSTGNATDKKFTLRGKVFKVVWSSGEGVNRKLKITINQGACGKAYSEGRPVSADYTKQPKPVSNFTAEQERLVSDLRFVISFPLVSGEQKIDRVVSDVQGVLNIEGISDGSESLLTDTTKNAKFYQEVLEFRKICGKLLS